MSIRLDEVAVAPWELGHEVVRRKGSRWIVPVSAKGSTPREIDQHAQYELHRPNPREVWDAFVALAEADERQLLSFANRYGLLGLEHTDAPSRHFVGERRRHSYRGESADTWRALAAEFAASVRLACALKSKKVVALRREFIAVASREPWFGFDDVFEPQEAQWSLGLVAAPFLRECPLNQNTPDFVVVGGAPREPGILELGHVDRPRPITDSTTYRDAEKKAFVGLKLKRPILERAGNLVLNERFGVDRGPTVAIGLAPGGEGWVLRPTDLSSLLWHQTAQLCFDVEKLRVCAAPGCSNFIRLGANQRIDPVTKKPKRVRKSKMYCDDDCKTDAYIARRRNRA